MFHISDKTIDIAAAYKSMQLEEAGGFVAFEGWVRNHNEGKTVKSLEYEIYHSMALKEGNKLLEEALERFDIHKAVCIHREGHLELGDVAVYVACASSHRAAAFEACQFIIDKLKVRLPIWKKEHYTDGDSGWVECEQCAKHGHKHNH